MTTHGTGKGADTITSGLEGAWTNEPTKWDNGYLDNLLGYDYELTTSPAGAQQWTPTNPEAQDTVPDAHDPSKRHAPMMLTTDLALKVDPIYEPIVKRFHENPDQLADAFARPGTSCCTATWDRSRATSARGSPSRSCGRTRFPRPRARRSAPTTSPPSRARCSTPVCRSPSSCPPRGRRRRASAAPTSAAAPTGRGSASRRRRTGRSTSRASWPRCCRSSSSVQQDFNGASGGAKVSLADLIVLGGCAAVEKAAKDAGHDVTVPFSPGRTDATQEQTDVDSFAVLEPAADGFRNYLPAGEKLPPETLLLDRANLLTLTPPEMTVLVGGMRALNANCGSTAHGVFTDRPETLTNDFFVNLLDMGTEWKTSASDENVYEGRDRATGEAKWTATAVDLVFGANSQLRAIAEVYASDDGEEMFVRDFVAAWDKVMNLDRFDLD